MEVLDFMNEHKNWEEILTEEPYFIKVKRDGNYILLKYNQLSSDFSLPIVRECRGAIFYQESDGKYICVCYPFSKFGNYGESYVPEIDWDSTAVEEKVDGSLIKFFFHNNHWHIATNGTIDAFKATIGDSDINFGDLVYEALGGKKHYEQFCNLLDVNYTYMFELVSPKSKMTILYPETKLYYLGERDMLTMEESKNNEELMKFYGVLCPKLYPLNTFEACLEYVQHMTRDEEGFVIKDKYFNRMKLKSPEYLVAFHMENNGIITTKRIIEMIKMEVLDDFIAYCPEHRDKVEEVLKRIYVVAVYMEMEWTFASFYKDCDRKEFGKLFKDYKYSDYIFMKLDNPKLDAVDYIMTRWTKTILKMIKEVKI